MSPGIKFRTARVRVLQRVVDAVAVAVQGLRVAEALDNRIRADKPPNHRIIVSGIVVVETSGVKPLAGKPAVCS